MNRFLYTARAVFMGLLVTQIIATLHVYLSNADLYTTITAISDAGYLAIPNRHVVSSLNEFGPAFYGAWFFTLSIGAGLSVFAVCCAWTWDRIFGRNCALLVPLVLLWLGTVVAVNSQGLSPVVTSYFLFTPLVVFSSALKWMPEEREERVWSNRLSHILPIVLLTIIWTAHADEFLFLDIRDYLLLSNPAGKKVDDFYYRYTLYPAQVFKSLDQKTLKTCHVASIKDQALVRKIEDILIHYDYLPVAARAPIDLEIVASADVLSFRHRGKTVLQTSYEEFFSQQNKMLTYFSAQTDRHGPFRQATILCLLLGFPITLYVMVFASIHFVFGFLVGPTRCSLVTGALCFLIGLALLAPLRIGRSKTTDAMEVSKALASEYWQQRVTALRRVVDKGIEIGDLPAYHRMMISPHVPERYWLAKSLGESRDPGTYEDLVTLLDDPHPNVVSMAFHGLGQRGDKKAVSKILKKIETSGHWYNQWYAYRALRDLGWGQRPLSLQ
ncbi:MAG: HEAT repeat domain-containing protein [Thermodesulfobacteriota bacterium]|nr:HEAT repeat domain-containing protein [Thermodesulfobacteriota bacterium]